MFGTEICAILDSDFFALYFLTLVLHFRKGIRWHFSILLLFTWSLPFLV